jgi:hypothetical protein
MKHAVMCFLHFLVLHYRTKSQPLQPSQPLMQQAAQQQQQQHPACPVLQPLLLLGAV